MTAYINNNLLARGDSMESNNNSFEQYEKDYTYFKQQLSPYIVRVIQQEIDDQCDKLEYAGSCMFDESPDRIHLETIVTSIYNKVESMDMDNPDLQAEEVSYNPLTAKELRRCTGFNCPPPAPISDYTQYGRPNWLKDLIGVMLLNEMLYRRRRYQFYIHIK